jgi:hypothetical protein
MNLFYRLLTAILISFFAFSCGSEPEAPARTRPVQAVAPSTDAPEPQKAETPAPEQPEAPAETAETFDPASITKEEYDSAKADVKQFIQKLNGIIRAKNYTGWVSYLSAEYFSHISSREYLDRINRTFNLQLTSARDYFTRVVVPSRANDRIDNTEIDIQYVAQNKVIAFTVSQKGDRIRLYDLEKTDEGWTIINSPSFEKTNEG